MTGSRLLRMIERLEAQRLYLDFAAAAIVDVPGLVIEIGLGKGRTYSHLRRRLPGREIVAFDREIHAPDDARPDDDRVVLGDFRETLPAAAARFAARAALVHADFGSEKPERDAALAALLGPAIAPLVAPGGYVLADRPLDLGAGFRPLAGLAETTDFDYHGWRREGA